MNLPSLAIRLLTRVYACSVLPWSEIIREGDRTERAARHQVALGLVEVRRNPSRLAITVPGRIEHHRRRGRE
jgi:hypothetical protein